MENTFMQRHVWMCLSSEGFFFAFKHILLLLLLKLVETCVWGAATFSTLHSLQLLRVLFSFFLGSLRCTLTPRWQPCGGSFQIHKPGVLGCKWVRIPIPSRPRSVQALHTSPVNALHFDNVVCLALLIMWPGNHSSQPRLSSPPLLALKNIGMTFSPPPGPKCNQLQLKINLLRKHFTSSLNHIHSPFPSAHTTYIPHPVSSPYLNCRVINCTICSPYSRFSDCLGLLRIYPHQICVGVNGETLSASEKRTKNRNQGLNNSQDRCVQLDGLSHFPPHPHAWVKVLQSLSKTA